MRKLAALLSFFFLFINPSVVFASVLINEILPHPSSGADWIELYNTERTEFDISGWRIQDSTGDLTPFADGTKFSSSSAFYQIFASNRLNNGGDTIKLKDKDGNVVDEKSYSEDPGEGISFGRYPDGSNNWGILISVTANNPNSTLVPSPTVTPTATPTPVPSSTSAPSPTNIITPSLTPKPAATATKYISPTVKITPSAVPAEDGSVLGETTQVSATPMEEKIAGGSTKNSFPVFLALLGSGILFITAAVAVSMKQMRTNQK